MSTSAGDQTDLVSFLTLVENTLVIPDRRARVVINERTGTVVSGGDVRISQVTISHGDLKVEIDTEFFVSQPLLVRDTGSDVRTQVVPSTTIEVIEQKPISLSLSGDSSVAELVAALNEVKATSRDIIIILQAIKRAGAKDDAYYLGLADNVIEEGMAKVRGRAVFLDAADGGFRLLQVLTAH